MRKVTILTVVTVVAIAVGGYVYLQQPFNPALAEIEDKSDQFMEDIQFKDFDSSARYHHELEQDRVDIGRAIEQLFMVDPELLDIMNYRITRSELDSSGERGRVLMNVQFRPLKPDALSDDEDDDDVEEADIQLYWMYRHPECPLGSDCDGDEQVCIDGRNRTVHLDDVDYADLDVPEDEDDNDDGDRPFECDPSAEHQWFMNLDSTLEQRDYQ